MSLKLRLVRHLLSILLVILAGSLGYYLLFMGRYGLLECLYMTVIAITSVGFGEIVPVTGNPAAEIFTMMLITFGMGIILYAISSLTASLIEGELSGYLREKKMNQLIAKLHGHYIICGGGETGGPLIDEMVKNHEAVVLIEREQAAIDRCNSDGKLLFIQGDATEDQNLVAAGIANASGLFACLPSEKENLYITMTARMLNAHLRIVSRMINPQLEPKLRKAGANSVVSPNTIGALRMASVMIRPEVVSFLDTMLRSKQGNLRVHQLTVTETGSAADKPLMDSGLKNRFNLLVLGIHRPGEEVFFNPPPNHILKPGMVLIVMGDTQDIARARREF